MRWTYSSFFIAFVSISARITTIWLLFSLYWLILLISACYMHVWRVVLHWPLHHRLSPSIIASLSRLQHPKCVIHRIKLWILRFVEDAIGPQSSHLFLSQRRYMPRIIFHEYQSGPVRMVAKRSEEIYHSFAYKIYRIIILQITLTLTQSQ